MTAPAVRAPSRPRPAPPAIAGGAPPVPVALRRADQHSFARWRPDHIEPGRSGAFAVWIDGELAYVAVAARDLRGAIDRIARGDRTDPFVAGVCEQWVAPRLRMDKVLERDTGPRLLDRLTAATLITRGTVSWWCTD